MESLNDNKWTLKAPSQRQAWFCRHRQDGISATRASHICCPHRLPRSSLRSTARWFWGSTSNLYHTSFICNNAAGKFAVHPRWPFHHFNHNHSAIFLFTKVTADSPAALPQSVYHFFSTNGASVVACVLQDLWRLFGSTDRAEVSCGGKRLTSAKKNGEKPEEEARLPPPTVLSSSIGFLISGPPGLSGGQPVAPTCSKCTT